MSMFSCRVLSAAIKREKSEIHHFDTVPVLITLISGETRVSISIEIFGNFIKTGREIFYIARFQQPQKQNQKKKKKKKKK